MALPQPAFDLLRTLAPCRLLSLGYPDLLIADEFDVPEVANADLQRRNHSWQGKIYETDAVFRKLGIVATYADISSHTGLEVPIDLNAKITDAPQFDAVLDPGTLEHCQNTAAEVTEHLSQFIDGDDRLVVVEFTKKPQYTRMFKTGADWIDARFE